MSGSRIPDAPAGSAGASGISRRTFVGALLAAPLGPANGVSVAKPGASTAGSAVRRSRDHVVVVGAGAFGGWTALALLRSGVRVTLVDAWGAGHSRSSSGGETRVIRAVYGGVPVYGEMVLRALELWREAERRWSRKLYHHTGALWMCSGDDGYVRRSIEPLEALGLGVEELSLGEASRRYPQMGFGEVRSIFLEREAGFIAARFACELVREAVVREGGEYRRAWAGPGASTGSRLTNLRMSDGGSLVADRFVFACGPWLGQLFPDVVGRRVIATRQEVFFFGTPPGDARYGVGSVPAWLHLGDRTVYGLPDHDRRGLKIADDSAGEEVDPTTMERAPSTAGLARAREILRQRFPALGDAPLTEARVCQYETSSDGHFLLDRHPALENVWLAGGGSGHGFKMGPALGEHVAALVQGRARAHPLFTHGRLRQQPAGRP